MTCVWPIRQRWFADGFHDGEELSSSISEWRINLQKSWQNFMDNFITIRRRDDTAVPLLAPNQDIYLREIFALACWSQHKLTASPGRDLSPGAGERLTWVRACYDTDDATTKAFLDEVEPVSQQNIP
ncbi:uroporphyrinogen-III C-methyltransferase [Shigella boydii]